MERSEIWKKLITLMMDSLPKLIGKERLLQFDETRIADDLQMDSFDIITLQVALEDYFGFEFDPLEDDFEFIFKTIGNLADYIFSKYMD